MSSIIVSMKLMCFKISILEGCSLAAASPVPSFNNCEIFKNVTTANAKSLLYYDCVGTV